MLVFDLFSWCAGRDRQHKSKKKTKKEDKEGKEEEQFFFLPFPSVSMSSTSIQPTTAPFEGKELVIIGDPVSFEAKKKKFLEGGKDSLQVDIFPHGLFTFPWLCSPLSLLIPFAFATFCRSSLILI